jgi:hypothetical protein
MTKCKKMGNHSGRNKTVSPTIVKFQKLDSSIYNL